MKKEGTKWKKGEDEGKSREKKKLKWMGKTKK